MKKIAIIFIAILVLLAMCNSKKFQHFCSNSLCYLFENNGFFIPEESSIFRFKATKWNSGSGEWWLYGEDDKYYYALNTEEPYLPKYFKLQKGNEPKNFDKLNYHTWLLKNNDNMTDEKSYVERHIDSGVEYRKNNILYIFKDGALTTIEQLDWGGTEELPESYLYVYSDTPKEIIYTDISGDKSRTEIHLKINLKKTVFNEKYNSKEGHQTRKYEASTPLDIWIKLSETFSWDTFSKLESGYSEQEWDGLDGTTTVETQSGTYSVTNYGGDELEEFFKILSDYLRTIYEQANESEKQIIDFGQNAQITFNGKIYEAEIQVSDKMMKNNGHCLICTYCISTPNPNANNFPLTWENISEKCTLKNKDLIEYVNQLNKYEKLYGVADEPFCILLGKNIGVSKTLYQAGLNNICIVQNECENITNV